MRTEAEIRRKLAELMEKLVELEQRHSLEGHEEESFDVMRERVQTLLWVMEKPDPISVFIVLPDAEKVLRELPANRPSGKVARDVMCEFDMTADVVYFGWRHVDGTRRIPPTRTLGEVGVPPGSELELVLIP